MKFKYFLLNQGITTKPLDNLNFNVEDYKKKTRLKTLLTYENRPVLYIFFTKSV